MSGLLALLDDVAALTRLTAASIDDIAASAAKAGSKAMGVVIDDAAVTPAYVHGVRAERELPMIGRIALGSLRNKLFLAPALLLLNWLWPAGVSLLLLAGGAYLGFEGAEKVWHYIAPHSEDVTGDDDAVGDPATLEEARVSGAVKTDFILSAEIMTVALAAIGAPSLPMQALALIAAGLFVTVLVYGVVAVIVKLDDMGLFMARHARFGATRAVGRGMVKSLPVILTLLSAVGVLAMLWVGGGIFHHSLHALGWHSLSDAHDALAAMAAASFSTLVGAGGDTVVLWLAGAMLDAVLGLALGIVLVLLIAYVARPLWRRIRPGGDASPDA